MRQSTQYLELGVGLKLLLLLETHLACLISFLALTTRAEIESDLLDIDSRVMFPNVFVRRTSLRLEGVSAVFLPAALLINP